MTLLILPVSYFQATAYDDLKIDGSVKFWGVALLLISIAMAVLSDMPGRVAAVVGFVFWLIFAVSMFVVFLTEFQATVPASTFGVITNTYIARRHWITSTRY